MPKKPGSSLLGKIAAIDVTADPSFQGADQDKKPALLPKDIFALLSKTVIGQEQAKKSLAVIIYQQLKRYALRSENKNLAKTNALLVGPTGCGKTIMARTLADIVGLPFLQIDATSLVQRGYRGGTHIDQFVDLLFSAAKGDRKRAEYAVVFIDEIDKLAYNPHNESELATFGVQQDLLSLIDGSEVFYEPDSAEYSRQSFSFCNVLFLFGGAFTGLSHKKELAVSDLYSFGLMPEFANRLGNIICLDCLSEEIIRQLTHQTVRQYAAYVSMTNAEENAYAEIIFSLLLADKSYEQMGGRCVAPLVRDFFEDLIFSYENKKGGE